MAQSRRWQSLDNEIESLRKFLLPRKFDSLGQYPRPRLTQARTRAFLVLSHAELESFFEQWAKELARKSEEIWKNNKRMTQPLAALMATTENHVVVNDKQTLAPQDMITAQVDQFVRQRYEAYYKIIKDNHGIKEINLMRLLTPLGIPGSVFGSTLLPSLNSFGSSRGLHGHNSVRFIQSVLDPETEYNRAKSLATDLKALDYWLVQYRKKLR
jgi:hypothetical protein